MMFLDGMTKELPLRGAKRDSDNGEVKGNANRVAGLSTKHLIGRLSELPLTKYKRCRNNPY